MDDLAASLLGMEERVVSMETTLSNQLGNEGAAGPPQVPPSATTETMLARMTLVEARLKGVEAKVVFVSQVVSPKEICVCHVVVVNLLLQGYKSSDFSLISNYNLSGNCFENSSVEHVSHDLIIDLVSSEKDFVLFQTFSLNPDLLPCFSRSRDMR